MQSKSALFSHMHTFCGMDVTFWLLNGRAEFTRYETIDTFSALQSHPPGRMSTSFKIRCQPFGAHVRNSVTLKVWHHRTKHQSSPSLHKIVLCQLSCLLPCYLWRQCNNLLSWKWFFTVLVFDVAPQIKARGTPVIWLRETLERRRHEGSFHRHKESLIRPMLEMPPSCNRRLHRQSFKKILQNS